jgi:hypothetical protein
MCGAKPVVSVEILLPTCKMRQWAHGACVASLLLPLDLRFLCSPLSRITMRTLDKGVDTSKNPAGACVLPTSKSSSSSTSLSLQGPSSRSFCLLCASSCLKNSCRHVSGCAYLSDLSGHLYAALPSPSDTLGLLLFHFLAQKVNQFLGSEKYLCYRKIDV